MFEIYSIPIEFDIYSGRSMQNTREQMRYENPWNDLFIDELNLAIHNTEREIELRGPNFNSYWLKLPREDQLIAESEREWLIELLSELSAARANYIYESYLPAELERWDETFKNFHFIIDVSRKESKTAANNAATMIAYAEQQRIPALYPSDRSIRVRQMRNLAALLHLNNPAHGRESEISLSPWSEAEKRNILPMRPGLREIESLRRWRDRLAAIQDQLYRGWSLMMCDLDERENELEGPTAAKHRLLTNHNVPLPSTASFIGWYQYAGVAFRRLGPIESLRLHGLCGFTPEAVLTYICPLMPMTKEHLSHSLINEDGSQSQFSLPARSKGHLRSKTHNTIEYGFWEARTVLMNEKHRYEVMTESLSEMSMPSLSIHERHCDSVSGLRSTVAQYFNGRVNLAFLMDGLSTEEARQINTEVSDPYMNQSAPDDFWLPIRVPTITHTWASLAKFYGVHLRFDVSLDGTSAIDAWSEAFELAAQWNMFASQNQRLANQHQQMAVFTKKFRNPLERVSVKVNGAKQSFDFGSL